LDLVLILLLALLIDLTVGEYPSWLHPTVWSGRLVEFMIKPGLKFKARLQFIYGALVSLSIITLFAGAAFLVLSWIHGINQWLFIVTGALILKPAFCLKGQWQMAEKTRRVLESEDVIPLNMNGLFSTVSHKDSITANDIISSSVRSIAENASDFMTAPIFYYLFFGVPGAIAYRMINTLDNMIGYHGKFEYLGKFAARLDDAANFIPARLTGLFIVFSAWFQRLDFKTTWRTMLSDHSKTPGPNGGWPMAATAGALGLRLYKVGHYEIGHSTRELTPGSITEAVSLYRFSMTAWIAVAMVAITGIALLRG
jgi:adenosylcobinamide-phosphate synthase